MQDFKKEYGNIRALVAEAPQAITMQNNKHRHIQVTLSSTKSKRYEKIRT
jgi:hypothetical protein